MIPRKQLFIGIYILCHCGCKGYVKLVSKHSEFNKYKNNHYQKLGGSYNPNWKGGRTKVKEYWYLRMPNYHRNDVRGYVPEHIYFYEQYNKLCILKWGEVHHIDGNTDNNMPWNLRGMMKRDHMRLHNKGNRYRRDKHIDTSDRRCHICNTDKTTMIKPNKNNEYKSACPHWLHLPWDKVNWYCNICYDREMRRRRNKIKV